MTKPRKRVKKSKGATKIEGSSEAKPINVAIIVGRASIDEDFDENGKRRRISERAKRRIMEEKQENWRAAAKALAHPFVFEGFRVNKPFTKMGNRVRKQKKFIDTLYIICHADIGGIGEIVRDRCLLLEQVLGAGHCDVNHAVHNRSPVLSRAASARAYFRLTRVCSTASCDLIDCALA